MIRALLLMIGCLLTAPVNPGDPHLADKPMRQTKPINDPNAPERGFSHVLTVKY